MKLLCADDEPDLRTILELALSIDPGLDVEIVSSGAELLERASHTRYDAFVQTTLRTDYLHGTLEPQLTFIADVNGYYGLQPTVSYRINDNFLVSGTYSMIAGSWKAGLATFRSHDMVQLRVTAQLN